MMPAQKRGPTYPLGPTYLRMIVSPAKERRVIRRRPKPPGVGGLCEPARHFRHLMAQRRIDAEDDRVAEAGVRDAMKGLFLARMSKFGDPALVAIRAQVHAHRNPP